MMSQYGFKAANRRYHWVFWPLMAIYVVAVMGGSWLMIVSDPAPLWMQIGAALASAIPVCATLFVMLRYFAETDEYTRLRQLKAFALGAVMVVSALFVVGFLQIFEVIGQVDVFWFGVGFFFCYGLAYCWQGFTGRSA